MSALTRYSLKDVAPKDGKNGADTWIVIHDMVYDVTRYKAEHPGGPELIDEYAGQDATIPFDDFGHSSEAIRMLKDYLIGELIQEDKRGNRKKKGSDTVKDKKKRWFLSKLCGNCAS